MRRFNWFLALFTIGLCVTGLLGPRTAPVHSWPERLPREQKARRGPELIRAFFADWHAPAPADLSPEDQAAIWSDVRKVPQEIAALDAEPWVSVGPFGIFGASAARNTGRVVDIDVTDTGVRHLAAASGGVWQLEGFPWYPITDGLDTQWMGSVDASPTDPDLILIGTGEPSIRAGTGVFRSTDGGATWQRRFLPGNPATCYRLRFQPDGRTVIGAFDTGIYRSPDGGVSWGRTVLANRPTDLALHPTDPAVMWAPVEGNGLWRSSNGGVSWSRITAPGLPTSGNGRGAVDVCAGDPSRLYVAFADASTNSMLGVFRTDDGGATWQDVSPPDDYMWGQGWYNNAIGVSPADPDLVLAGGGGLVRSTDGGATWTPTASPHVHADVHAIEWSNDGANLYVATDGGYSHSINGGASYLTPFNRMAITQYVNIDVGDALTMVMGGGSQDNAVSVTRDGGQVWWVEWGGDGGGFVIDDHDNTRMWNTSGVWSGDLKFRVARSTDNGSSWQDVNQGIAPSDQWYTRIRSDQQDPPTLYTNNGPRVYASTDAGDLWTPLGGVDLPTHAREMTVGTEADGGTAVFACLESTVSGRRLRVFHDGLWTERSTGLPAGFLLRRVCPDPAVPGRCYALMNGLGSPGQKIFRSDDAGLGWTNVTGNLPDVPLSDLVAHPDDPQRLYASTEFGCYATEDGGRTWVRWNLGLPESAMVTEMVLADRRRVAGVVEIYAGTYGRGIWKRPLPDLSASAAPELAGADVLLRPAHPNPADTGTTFRFRLPERGAVSLRLFDVRGRVVATPTDGEREAGEHVVAVDTRALPSGLYFARLRTPWGETTRRWSVVR